VQLERELRDAIRSGRLVAGERLPSSRMLAVELGISRGLVLECYSQLQAEWFLTASSGSATRVAPSALAESELPVRPAPLPRLAVDFRPGVPDLTSFPRRDWAWTLREACRNATPAQLGYGEPQGDVGLRDVLTAYLRRVRGTVADADQTREIFVANTWGHLSEDRQDLCRLSVQCVAFGKKGERRTGFYGGGGRVDFRFFDDFSPGQVGRKAARQAGRDALGTDLDAAALDALLAPEQLQELALAAAHVEHPRSGLHEAQDLAEILADLQPNPRA